jgi:phage terminase small subunit
VRVALAPPADRPLGNASYEHIAQMYARGDTQTAVAERTGYTKNGVADVLARYEVRERINHLVATQHRPAQITAERVMTELGRIAFSDIRHLYDEEGNLKPVHELSDDAAASITAIDVEVITRGRGEDAEPVVVKKIRRADKMGALGILAKHFKIIGDEGDGISALASSLADRLKLARRRDTSQAEDAVEIQPAALPHIQESDDEEPIW